MPCSSKQDGSRRTGHGAGHAPEAWPARRAKSRVLPYQYNQLSLLLVVPGAGRFAEVESALDIPALDAIASALTTHTVELGLPRFTVETATSLSGAGQRSWWHGRRSWRRGGATASGGVVGSGGATGGNSGTGGAATNPCLLIPTLDRSCATTEDCFAATTIADCCGSGRIVGLGKTEQADYADLLQQCQSVWPACACPVGSTVLDDGSTILSNTNVGVTCRQGVCTTFVPACEHPCPSGTTCFSCQVPGGQFAACTTPCQDVDGGTDCAEPDLPRCQQGGSGNTYGTYCTSATTICNLR